MARELAAYRSEDVTRRRVVIADLCSQAVIENVNARFGFDVERSSALALVFMSGTEDGGTQIEYVSRDYESTKRRKTSRPDEVQRRVDELVVVPYFTKEMTIERTIDLRVPEVQHWLWKSFAVEGAHAIVPEGMAFQQHAPSHFLGIPPEPIDSFFDMLPELLIGVRGAGIRPLNQGIGLWMRTHHVDARSFRLHEATAASRLRMATSPSFMAGTWSTPEPAVLPFVIDSVDTWVRRFGPDVTICQQAAAEQEGSWWIAGLEELREDRFRQHYETEWASRSRNSQRFVEQMDAVLRHLGALVRAQGGLDPDAADDLLRIARHFEEIGFTGFATFLKRFREGGRDAALLLADLELDPAESAFVSSLMSGLQEGDGPAGKSA